MQRVGEHPVPAGPLAVRWQAFELDDLRAGTRGHARLAFENAGSASWQSREKAGIQLAYHWLDRLGNPIVWDGARTPLPRTVAPGESIELEAVVIAPRPPGGYRLAFDLVEEHRFWLQEVGSSPLEIPVEVQPRIAGRRLAVVLHGPEDDETAAALQAQEEPLVTEGAEALAHLVPGALPAPDWSRRLLDAHQEGYAAVGGAVEPLGGIGARARARSEARRLAAWAPGSGRNPRFHEPLLFPSLLDGLEPSTHEGLPAYSGGDALFDGNAVVRLQRRSGRPSG